MFKLFEGLVDPYALYTRSDNPPRRLDGGHIAEEGSHAALLSKGGLYAQFWARQSGGFLGDVTDNITEEAAE